MHSSLRWSGQCDHMLSEPQQIVEDEALLFVVFHVTDAMTATSQDANTLAAILPAWPKSGSFPAPNGGLFFIIVLVKNTSQLFPGLFKVLGALRRPQVVKERLRVGPCVALKAEEAKRERFTLELITPAVFSEDSGTSGSSSVGTLGSSMSP